MGKPGNISTWTCEVFHITRGDRIDRTQHNNRDCFGRFFSRTNHDVISGEDHVDFLLYELVYERRQPIQSSLRKPVFDHDGFAFYITEIAQLLLECVKHGRVASCGGYEPYPGYGLRRLLSAGGVEGTKNKTTNYQDKEFFFHNYKPRYSAIFSLTKLRRFIEPTSGSQRRIVLGMIRPVSRQGDRDAT
jgi:hypothetical protein